MYPGQSYVSEHYSILAVHYLWKLSQLDQVKDISNNLRKAIRCGLELADEAAKAHGMNRVPKKASSFEEAYAIASDGKNPASVVGFIDSSIDFSGKQAKIKDPRHAVANRSSMAYAAACLISSGDLGRGIKLANQVTRQFNEQGSLYSTVDSVAAICLMVQLRISGMVTGEGRVKVNGEEMTTLQASQLSDQVESIEVMDGIAAVEVTRIVEEDWDSFSNAFPVKVGFRSTRDKKMKHFKAGDRTELLVELKDGYQAGDLVHVALPACMAWIQGGGKVKKFTLDFEGRDNLKVPLVVTSDIEGKQHFAVCVRNMFEEERATSPGLLTVKS